MIIRAFGMILVFIWFSFL